MGKKEEYETKTEAFLTPFVKEQGFELVDVEYVKEGGNWYLRAYLDKEGGITIDDCETVSRRLGEWLDERDFIADSYILEVSSPGLMRPLKKEKDFIRNIGKQVDVKLFKPLNKQKDFTGNLVSYDKDTVSISLEDGTLLVCNRPEIALIRLAFDF